MSASMRSPTGANAALGIAGTVVVGVGGLVTVVAGVVIVGAGWGGRLQETSAATPSAMAAAARARPIRDPDMVATVAGPGVGFTR